ncbi:Metal transporter CNNM4-like [Oopsacas minuta]|uniref:Metal transporter CNNM4-like n=1 Tax=Oopsacas minuta TaxID=111878 RepID=A0AAV7K102_9METZ|nr:Metal transporter CNNM4-like [Oopsacas minuta]
MSISAQQSLAVYLYLSTTVEPFKHPLLTKRILQRLVEQDIYWSISKEQVEVNDYYLYEKGKQANHFTLILEGKLQVTVGNDELQYEAGPFTTFGTKVLTRYTELSDHNFGKLNFIPYIPDFSVKPLTDVTLLYIPFRHYIVAVKASCAEKDAELIFEEEWQKTKEEDPIRPADAYILVHHGTAINHKSSSEDVETPPEHIPPATHRYKRKISTRSITSPDLGQLELEAHAHKSTNGNEMLIRRMASCVNTSDSEDDDDNIIASDKSRLIK